ncbi:MAG: GntR family transcriptional regulator [Tagaea sp.]
MSAKRKRGTPSPSAASDAVSLDRASPIPLYVQVRNRLLAMVGGWTDPERRFYSDEELTAMFGVSRATVREALAELVEAGVLRRTRGRGTAVSLRKVEEKLTPGMNIRRQWEAEGRPITASVLAFERVGASPAIAEALDVPPGADVLFVKRVRATAIAPVAIDWRYLPAALGDGLKRADAATSLLHTLWHKVDLDHSELTIEAALSGPEEMELLHLPANSPVLVRHLVYFDRAGRRVMAGQSIHRADLMRYSIRIDLSRADAGMARGTTLLRRR